MSLLQQDSSKEPADLEKINSSVHNNADNLASVLFGLNITLEKLTKASESQTEAIVGLKEDILLTTVDPAEDDSDSEKQDSSLDLSAILNECLLDPSKNTCTTQQTPQDRSDSEQEKQNDLVDSLTQAYITNTTKSPAIQGKIAELIDDMLTGGLSIETIKTNADKYPAPENCKLLPLTSVNE
jgi:hypothetical protein